MPRNATVSWVDPSNPNDVREAEDTDKVDVVTDLEFDKTVEPDRLRVGQEALFTLTVSNPTCRVVHKLNFTDELPEGLEYKKGSSKLNGKAIEDPVMSGRLFIWNTSLTLNPGETYVLQFYASVAPGTQGGSRINLAGVYGIDQYDVPINATDTAGLYIRGKRGGLEINKEASRMEVAVNDTVTFIITITNHWKVPVYDVDVWDLLPCCLTYAGGSTVQGSPEEPEHPKTLPSSWGSSR